MYNNFSFLNIINGLSKTLNIANQMIPLYKQVKPLITNSNKVISNLQNLKFNANPQNNKVNNQTINNTSLIKQINTPTFFQ